ncbi:MAG: phosphoglycolate phosphatase [Methanocorpusculum sp.]|nr:phosphoglycolate phosphatase [Methanocorpusculum sp.]
MPKAYITDIDGTLTDNNRRLSLSAVAEIRRLIDCEIPVVLASGNTVCFLDGLSHMIGTKGAIIAENGGVYRNGYLEEKYIVGNKNLCMEAYKKIIDELKPKGEELRLFSAEYRFSDIAFSRDISVETARDIIKNTGVEAVDTGFAIHLHTPNISKGAAFEKLARLMGLKTADFLCTGDSVNDVEMLKLSGISVTPANGSTEAKSVACCITEKPFGEGVADALKKYF